MYVLDIMRASGNMAFAFSSVEGRPRLLVFLVWTVVWPGNVVQVIVVVIDARLYLQHVEVQSIRWRRWHRVSEYDVDRKSLAVRRSVSQSRLATQYGLALGISCRSMSALGM